MVTAQAPGAARTCRSARGRRRRAAKRSCRLPITASLVSRTACGIVVLAPIPFTETSPMQRLQCRQGHEWDFDEARTLSLSEETCPTCGAAATVMNQTTDASRSKKDDGTINLETGAPAPASEREE